MRRLVFGTAALLALTCGAPAAGGKTGEWGEAGTAPARRAELLVLLEAERSAGGYGDFAPLAAELLRGAAGAPSFGDAEAFGRLAAAAAPSDPRPPAFLAKLYLSGRPRDSLAEGWRSLALALRDPWFQAAGVLRLGAAAVLAAWAAALALLVAGGAGRVGLVFHDYRDSFPRDFRRWTPALLLALIAVALWTAGAGPALFLLLGGLALVPYYPLRPRWALGVCLGMGSLLGLAMGVLSSLGGPPGERAWALYRVWKGDGGVALDAELERIFPPDDHRGLFARARVARRGHRLEEAAGLVEVALAQPGAPRALLHQELGTLRFLQRRSEDALEQFGAASAADPTDPMPWLNRHVLHLHRLEFGLADGALERAWALDAAVVARTRRPSTEVSHHLMLLAPAMPKEWVREELLRRAAASSRWAENLSRGLFIPIQVFEPALLGLLALGSFLPAERSGAGRRSHRCPSCGVVVCPRCGRRVKETLLCPVCWAAGREDAADSAEKDRHTQRMGEWKARRERWTRLGRILFPGWSDFLVTGAFTSLALGILWAGVVGWAAQSLLYPVPLLPWLPPATPWGAVAVAAAIHATGAWACLRRPSSAQG